MTDHRTGDDPSSADGWDFDALNARARELRAVVRESGLEGMMSEVAGETMWLAPGELPDTTATGREGQK